MQSLDPHKIVILGQSGVGKSSIVTRFINDHYSPYMGSTIGASFFTKTVNINNQHIKLDIWDTAGQERYYSLTPMYYRGAQGAIIVYDITDVDSYQRAQNWLRELIVHYRSQSIDQFPIVYFVGNKSDLLKTGNTQRQVSFEACDQYCKEKNVSYLEVSAKTGHNIMELFHELGYKVHEKYNKSRQENKNKALYLQLDDENVVDENTSRKCCW